MRALLRGTIAAVALSLAPLAVVTTTAASAQAAETLATTTTLDPDIQKRGEFGRYLSITADVRVAGSDSSPFEGTSFLQRQAPGSKEWKNIGSDDSAGFSFFPNYDEYKGNAKFRVFYAGGTSGDTTWSPSVSKVISIKVTRVMEARNVAGKRKPTADLTVKPKFGKKKLLIQKKKGKKYKTFRKVKTNKKGKVRFSLQGSRKGIKYRVVAPGNKQFVATKLILTATQSRSLPRSVG